MKNIDFVIKKTAQDLGLPEDQVKIVVMEYWNSVYSKVLNMESEVLAIKHIGLFTGSRYKINNYVRKAIKKIRGVQKSKEYSDDVKKKILEKKYTKLRQALIQRNSIAIRYAKEFKNI